MKKIFLSLLISTIATPGLNAQCSTFYDGFETASFGAGWTMQGGYTTTFPSTGSAVGTYHLVLAGTSGHYGGPYVTFPAMQVGYISYRIRTTSTTTANNYFVIGDANTTTNNGILFNYVNTTGNLRFYSGAAADYNYPITANVWYHVEIMNINWTAKTYDIYINGTLMVTAHPFRSTASTAVDRFYIYNYNSATSNYDEIIIGGSPITATSSLTNVSCFSNSDGSATVSPSGGTGIYTYNWAPTGGTSATASNLSAGSYTCTITDGNGCSGTAVVNIAEPSAIAATVTQTDVFCNGGNNGSATVLASGGTPSYSYSWSPTGGTSATATGLNAGTYSCVITDANGCSATETVSITEPPVLAITGTQTNVTCFFSCDGVASVNITGGTSPYDYNWNPSAPISPIASNLCAGSYTCIVTDVNGCTIDMAFTLTSPPMLSATTTQTNVSCAGGSDGSSVIAATGGTAPYMYQWSPAGGNSDTATGLSAGTYTCTITDAGGCTATHTIGVTEPPAISTSVTSVDVVCNGGATGSIDLTVTGGTAPFTFDWNSGAYTTEDLTGLTAGTYVGVLTDANGCTDGGTVVINEATAITSTATSNGPTTCGGNNGSIDQTVAGGSGPYTYMWSNSATTEDLSGVTAGSYTVTITDSLGCMMSFTYTLSDPAGPTVTLGITTSTMCFDDGSLTLSGGSPAGGTWSGPGVTGGMFDPSVAGNGMQTVTYSYTDANNCVGTATDSINVDPCAGVIENNASAITVYPNPTTGVFTVTSETGASIVVYNALGEVVTATVASTTKSQLNLSELSEGIYFVVVAQNGVSTTERIVLSK